jgi:hypothetical protein
MRIFAVAHILRLVVGERRDILERFVAAHFFEVIGDQRVVIGRRAKNLVRKIQPRFI